MKRIRNVHLRQIRVMLTIFGTQQLNLCHQIAYCKVCYTAPVNDSV
jgi:hypothetical protein